MSKEPRISNAERLGRWAGRFWRGYVRQERRAAGWLVARGLPVGGAKALLWSVKLILLGVLLYAAFWLAVLLLFAVTAAWAAANSGPVEEDEFPFMTEEERKKSMFYDPVAYNDTSHPDYEDN